MAKSEKPACGLTISPVSGINSSLLSSRSRFNASKTSDGARLSSALIEFKVHSYNQCLKCRIIIDFIDIYVHFHD